MAVDQITTDRIKDWNTYSTTADQGLLGLSAIAWFWFASCPSFFKYNDLEKLFNRDAISQDWKTNVVEGKGTLGQERLDYAELNFLSGLARDLKMRHRSRVRAIIYESNKQRVCAIGVLDILTQRLNQLSAMSVTNNSTG